MWTEVTSSVPHFLHMGSLHSSIICKCLLKVLCPISRPITTLGCVLLKDSSRALVARSGPEINSWACLCVLQGQCHNTRCWFAIQRFIFLLIFCLETPRKGSGPINRWIEASLSSLSAISFPWTPACPGTQYSPTVCLVFSAQVTYPGMNEIWLLQGWRIGVKPSSKYKTDKYRMLQETHKQGKQGRPDSSLCNTSQGNKYRNWTCIYWTPTSLPRSRKSNSKPYLVTIQSPDHHTSS
jgi:hypothetical protein